MSICARPVTTLFFFVFWFLNQVLLFLLPIPVWLTVLLSCILVLAFFCLLRCLTALIGASFLWLDDERLMFRFTDGRFFIHQSPRLVVVNDYFVYWLWSGKSYLVSREMVSTFGFHQLCYGLMKIDRQA